MHLESDTQWNEIIFAEYHPTQWNSTKDTGLTYFLKMTFLGQFSSQVPLLPWTNKHTVEKED